MPGLPVPVLLTPDGQSAAGKTLEVPASGLRLLVRLPAVASGKLELTGAALTLEGPAGTTDLAGGGSANLVVVTSLGPLSAGWASEKAADVAWITADWGARRSVASVNVACAGAGAAGQAKLQIADGGAWFPPLPVEAIPFNGERPLPDVVATRIMIELPAASRPSGLTVKLAAQPSGLRVRVGSQPPLFERQGRLLPGEKVRIAGGLLEALQRLAPADGKAADLELFLEADLPGSVKVASVELSAVAVRTALDPPAAPLSLSWEGEAVGRATVGAGVQLSRVVFQIAPSLRPERIRLAASPQPAPVRGQLCDPVHRTAQPFPGLGATALAGVDLLLRPTRAPLAGTVSLHPDLGGRPGETPFSGAELPFAAEAAGDPPWIPIWVPVDLPGPLLLPRPWWLVVKVAQGEALWPLSASLPMMVLGSGPVLRRGGAGAPFPWEPIPEKLWAMCRLRVASQDPAPPFRVELRRGPNLERQVAPDAAGRVEVSEAVLSALGSIDPVLEVAVWSAGAPVAGTIDLQDLRISVK